MARTKQPPAVRRQRIVELVGTSEFIVPADIAEALDVSGETIRRDLMMLEQSGLLRRVHGGAIQEIVGSSEPDRASRTAFRRAEKREIAAAAVELIQPADALFLDVGTTVEAIAEALPRSFHGTVITNSLHVAFMLGDRDEIRIEVLGGTLRAGEFTTSGPDAEAQAGRFHADIAFIGASGVSIDAGMTDYSVEDSAVKQIMIAHSTRSFAVVGSEKIGKKALRTVCSLTDLAGVITDSRVALATTQQFEDAGLLLLSHGSGRNRSPARIG
ncbi:MAG: DeoR family transcriptional regulator [Cryobacterium sp.]|jgi:DeoR family fructose operon transcriptional repressor|nr:DeoR family transcriptional regulator [Cryobacterium sp.]